jgi:NADH-quinone oxidoreductase subunit L
VLWVVGLLTSLLTATYMFRLVFLAFHGERAAPAADDAHAIPPYDVHPSHDDAHAAPSHLAPSHAGSHLHDAPPAMAIVLIVLAIGSVVAGYAGLPGVLRGGDWFARYLAPSFGSAPLEDVAEHGIEGTLMLVSVAVAVVGIGLATFFFLKNRRAADAMADRFAGLHSLLLNKYYVDELYDATIIQPVRIVSEDALWKVVDVNLIDAAVNGVGETVVGASARLRRLQSGSVRASAAYVFFGVVMILGYYLWR